MNTISGFAAFKSGLYSPYWKRMGLLISGNAAKRIWQSKHCVLCGDICERVYDGNIYVSCGYGEETLDAYIESPGDFVRAAAMSGAIWNGKEERLIVFSAEKPQCEIFYANPPGRFVFSSIKEGLYSFPGVYAAPDEKSGICRLSPGGVVCFDRSGII